MKVTTPDRSIIYLDETWVNQTDSVSEVWADEKDERGLKVPTGKTMRLVVIHAGSRKGFVNNYADVFANLRLALTITMYLIQNTLKNGLLNC